MVAALCVFGVCLGFEVFCFSVIAVAVYHRGTCRIFMHREQSVQLILSSILNFIQNGKDKKLRILAINQGLNEVAQVNNGSLNLSKICDFSNKILKDEGFDGLRNVTYKDISDNTNAKLFSAFWKNILDEYSDLKNDLGRGNYIDKFMYFWMFIGYIMMIFIFAPILFLSKILQVLFPWIIFGYLVYNNLLFSNQIELFQLMMLAVYIGLQLILLVLGIKVLRIHWWLWHIFPGDTEMDLRNISVLHLEREVSEYYDNVCWYPQVEKIVLNVFGNDIGPIIMDYCKSIEMSQA